nr:putative phospholipid hydroperoxide glutathione peroxidase [Ipomoea batatas]
MGLFRRLAGILGFSREEGQEVHEENGDAGANLASPSAVAAAVAAAAQAQHLHRRGFSVPIQVQVDRPAPGPVLLPCTAGDGGVQGLRWYAKRLRVDEDGDVADEFINEVLPEKLSIEEQDRQFPRFEVKYQTRPAKIRNQVLSSAGKIQLCVEHQGRLEI